MSGLSKLIRRATRAEPPPMGFGAGPSRPAPTMLLAALVGERWARAVGDAIAAGADVLILAGRPNDRELTEAAAAADGRPCGLLAGQADADQASKLREAGIDFVVLELQAPARVLLDQELGVLLHLKDDLSDILLRTLEPLPLDAIYVERDTSPLTLLHQMELQRISGLARKPLLLQVRPDVEQPDLLCLRDAGVAATAVDLRERGALEGLRRLRAVVDALPPRRPPRREERPEVLLPGAVSEGEPEEEEEE